MLSTVINELCTVLPLLPYYSSIIPVCSVYFYKFVKIRLN